MGYIRAVRTVGILAMAVAFLASPAWAPAGETLVQQQAPIDRESLVNRHNIEWNDVAGQIPLGNGEFCFNADGTGLQTFGGNTLAHWAWHSAPLPEGCTPEDVPPTGTVERGRITGPMRKAADKPQINGWNSWLWRNPHPVNLGRLRLVRADGTEIRADEVRNLSRTYTLMTGLHRSQFEIDGQRVTVQTAVHGKSDIVAIRVESQLVRDKKLAIALDFPYPAAEGGGPWAGNWNRPMAHSSKLAAGASAQTDRTTIRRVADATAYEVAVAWAPGCAFQKLPETPQGKLTIVSARYGEGDHWEDVTKKVSAAVREAQLSIVASNENFGDPALQRSKKLQVSYTLDGLARQAEVGEGQTLAIQTVSNRHSFLLLPGAGSERMDMVCGFAPQATDPMTFEQVQASAAERWKDFWMAGGAIDLSASKDPRWRELERRIVLSQYQMAAQSAGGWPSSEAGLIGIDGWSGQFHMEMVWWHEAHYALWGRYAMAEKALECYPKFLPLARQLAAQFGYKGAKWGKMVGPEGRTAPWEGSFILHWQQPHPIFFAELEYRIRPTPQTLEKWKEIVFATADYLADFPTREENGIYHLQPVMPPCEQGVTRDTVFDLAYFRWGLDQAQRWRERLGMPREPKWDEVRRGLAPLPQVDGVYVHSAEWLDTYTKRAWEHPDPIGVLGMLPPMEGVDPAAAKRTVNKVWRTWDWRRCWGWDFPYMAMAAARVGEPQIAIEALLKDAGDRNGYDMRGVNTGGPCPYLPGNGGLLYAAAMMAAGWEGAPARLAPGFPDDGTWVVKWEDLRPAP